MSSRASATRWRAVCGVTLVEMMVALVLIGLLMAPLAALLANAASSGAVSANQLDLQNQVQFALQRIDRQIQNTPNAALPAKSDDETSGTWLPVTYKLLSGSAAGTRRLVESNATETYTLAEPVSSFSITSPSVTTGKTLIAVSLTLARANAQANASHVTRMGLTQ